MLEKWNKYDFIAKQVRKSVAKVASTARWHPSQLVVEQARHDCLMMGVNYLLAGLP